jgi:hypothetical protein
VLVLLADLILCQRVCRYHAKPELSVIYTTEFGSGIAYSAVTRQTTQHLAVAMLSCKNGSLGISVNYSGKNSTVLNPTQING